MAAKDKDHLIVIKALEKDGWIITDDPFYIHAKGYTYQADLGAERLLSAAKGEEKIVVEIKTFLGTSKIYDFHQAIGQFHNYKTGLMDMKSERDLYLAMPHEIYEELFQHETIQNSAKLIGLKLAVYHRTKIEIVKWIN